MITFGSLFAGIGGFDLGFERAGMQCKWQVEIDDYATKVLEKHWPWTYRERDVCQCGIGNLCSVDMICGGDPCQGNSVAGSVHNKEREDVGSHFVRIVGELRPLCVVRENVAIEKRGAIRPWRAMLSELRGIGYECVPFRFPASMVGALHKRWRIIIVGFNSNSNCVGWKGVDREGVKAWNVSGVGGVQLHQGAFAKDACSTSRICGAGDGIPNRMDRLRCLGNAVVPQVAEWVGRRIVETLEGNRASIMAASGTGNQRNNRLDQVRMPEDVADLPHGGRQVPDDDRTDPLVAGTNATGRDTVHEQEDAHGAVDWRVAGGGD